MATANEKIRDSLIRHQIRLLQRAAGLGGEMQRILRAADDDLRFDIRRRLEALTGGFGKFTEAQTRRLQRLQEAITDLQAETWSTIREELRENLVQLGRVEVAGLAAATEAAMPVTLSLALPSSQALRSIISSQPFEGRLLSRWVTDLAVNDRRRIMDQVRIGMVQGESSTQISRRVFGSTAQRFKDGAREVTRREVASLTNTAVAFITNEARESLYEANKSVIPQEAFVATLDSRTTAECRALDGQVFDVGKGPRPPLHFNCRSLRVPIFNGRLLGTRPANATTKKMLEGLKGDERRRVVDQLVGRVPATQTYQEFLRNQSVDFQNDVLGKTKATLFRKGDLTLDRFVGTGGKELTIAELRRLEPAAFQRAGLAE